MKQQSTTKVDSIVIQTWGEYEFKLFPGSASTKPYLHFQYVNPETGKEERVRKLAGLKKGASLTTLKKEARLSAEWMIELLSNGFNPITNTSVDAPLTPLSGIRDCIDNYIKYFDEKLANGVIKDKTHQNMIRLLGWFKDWLKGKQYSMRKPNTFTYIDIDAFMQKYSKLRVWDKVSYNTYRGSLLTFFNYLVKLKVLSDNPVTNSDKKNTKKDSSRFKIFEEEELSHVVKLLESDKAYFELYVASKIIFYYNIRPIEITRIQVCDISFEKNLLTLSTEKTKNKNEAKWQLSDEMVELLKKLVGDAPGHYFVFANRNTPKPVQAQKDFLGQRWRYFRKKHNIPSHLKLYALKHSSDWYDLQSGVGIQAISERSRHANPNVTIAYVKERLNKNIIQPSASRLF
jgi:integrase